MKTLKNRKGQVVVESILLMVVMASLFVALTNYFQQSGIITKLVSQPWRKVAGMTETGTWDEPSKTSRANHPISNVRAYSRKP